MATTQHQLTTEICEYNHRLDAGLRRTVGISVQTYKVIKATAQLASVLAILFAMAKGGVDLDLAILVIGGIILGPEVIEAKLVDGEE